MGMPEGEGKQTDRRVAAVDVGGHDLKVYVTGGAEPDCYQVIPTNLRGAIMDDGKLDADAYRRTLEGLAEAADAIRSERAVETRVTTCSAGRTMDEAALAVLQGDVARLLNADLVVVPGEMEAELGFYGALSSIHVKSPRQHVITIDVGGGSTEVAEGTLDKGVASAVSMPVGGSSLKQMVNGERYDVESIEYLIDDYIADADLSKFKPTSGTVYVIIGGIACTLAAWMRAAKTMDPDAMNGVELLAEDLAPAGRMFFHLSPEEMADSGCVIPGREDSIGYAGLVLSSMVESLRAGTVVVSSGGVAQALTSDACWKQLLSAVRRR